MALFTPQIETQGAQQQVANPVTAGGAGAALQAFAPVAENLVETGIGFYQKGKLDKELGEVHEELKELDREFTNINDAIASGHKRSRLETRARTALNQAKAASPMLADYADQLYSSHFESLPSGGKSGSSFQASPQEQMATKVQEEIAEIQFSTGMSSEQAYKVVQNKKMGEIAKQEADRLANVAQVSLYEVQTTFSGMKNGWLQNFNEGVVRTMNTNGTGSLLPENKVQMKANLRTNLVQQKEDLRRMATDPETGRLTISPSELKRMEGELDAQYTSMVSVIDDSSYSKLLTEQVSISDNTTSLVVSQKFPQLAIAKEVGGEQLVNTLLTNGPDDALGAYLRATNPQTAQILENPQEYKGVLIDASGKMFQPGDAPKQSLNNSESVVMGSAMAQPNNPLALSVLTKADNPKAMTKIGRDFPDAVKAVSSPSTSALRKKGTGNVTENAKSLTYGAIQNFQSGYREEFNKFPSDIQIIVEEPEQLPLEAQYRGYGAGSQGNRISINTGGGEQLPQSLVDTIANIYRAVEANPEIVPDKNIEYRGEVVNLRGLSPAQVTGLWINSGQDLADIPEASTQQVRKQPKFFYGDAQSVEAGLYERPRQGSAGDDLITRTAEGRTEEAPKREVSEKVSTAVASFKERGYTLSGVEAEVDKLSELSDEEKEAMKADIRIAWEE